MPLAALLFLVCGAEPSATQSAAFANGLELVLADDNGPPPGSAYPPRRWSRIRCSRGPNSAFGPGGLRLSAFGATVGATGFCQESFGTPGFAFGLYLTFGYSHY
jgi:hypothetical protein